ALFSDEALVANTTGKIGEVLVDMGSSSRRHLAPPLSVTLIFGDLGVLRTRPRHVQNKRANQHDLDDVSGVGCSLQSNAAHHIAVSVFGDCSPVGIRSNPSTTGDSSSGYALASAANRNRHRHSSISTIEIRDNADGDVTRIVYQNNVIDARPQFHKVVTGRRKVVASRKRFENRVAHLAHVT